MNPAFKAFYESKTCNHGTNCVVCPIWNGKGLRACTHNYKKLLIAEVKQP
jgi:hypothetical protein